MELTKRISDLEPADRAVVERVFGHPLATEQDVWLVLRAADRMAGSGTDSGADVPVWFHVLEGLAEDDLAEVNAILERPVTLAHPVE